MDDSDVRYLAKYDSALLLQRLSILRFFRYLTAAALFAILLASVVPVSAQETPCIIQDDHSDHLSQYAGSYKLITFFNSDYHQVLTVDVYHCNIHNVNYEIERGLVLEMHSYTMNYETGKIYCEGCLDGYY